jgi:polar amino acid transport system substrate-binding protein
MRTTSRRVYFLSCLLLSVASCVNTGVAEDISGFRHVDSGQIAPPETVTSEVRLLADPDFAPYSYKNASGELVGISVDMVMAACAAAKLKCKLAAVPFADLLPSLARGEGDAIISGMRMTPKLMAELSLTRPFFVSTAQFISRLGSSFEVPDIKTLAGRRIGFVKGTSHQAFLEKYYGRSALTGFENEGDLFENLRTGGLDVAFADSLHAGFWMQGKTSRACCEALGGSFVHRASFSRGLAFVVKRAQPILRENLDYGLDQVQVSGEAIKIFKRYLPKASF